eukprot:2805109-Pyramimonas_sp.AAC.1
MARTDATFRDHPLRTPFWCRESATPVVPFAMARIDAAVRNHPLRTASGLCRDLRHGPHRRR